jgi:hypothetical protein
MRHTFIAAALTAALTSVAPLAFAQDVQPGLWQISLETRVPSEPGFQPPPYTMNQCITAEDAKDPGMLFSKMGNGGASGCRYSDRNYHGGNTFTFAMSCKGTYAIQSKGQVSFTKTTMDGNMSALATVNDKDVETQNKITARRVGGC